MAQTYSFSVDDIRKYNNQDPLPAGAGQVIMVPTQMMPMKLSDLSQIAENQTEISNQAAEPPEPPQPPAAPPGVPNLPGGQKPGTGDAGPGANPQNGAVPKPVGPGAGAKPGAGNKAIDDLYAAAIVPGLEEDVKASLINQIANKEMLAARVTNRFFRQPKPFRADGLKAVRKVSLDTAATGIYIRNRLMDFMNNAGSNHAGLKKAFRIQRREVLKALPDVVAAASKGKDAAERRRIVQDRLEPLLAARVDDLKRAVAPIHVAGIVSGFQTGVHVLPPAHAAILRQRLGSRKSVSMLAVEGKALDWQKYVGDWRAEDKGFAGQFDHLMTHAAQNVADMSVTELSAIVAEGLRRGYSEDQVMAGNPDEDYAGVIGQMDALEARAEAITRVEGGDAFKAGVAEALGVKFVDG
jgi:hypothetical protein